MLDCYYSLSCWKCLNVAETVQRVFIIDLLSCCRAYFQSQLVEEGCTILCLIFCLSSIPVCVYVNILGTWSNPHWPDFINRMCKWSSELLSVELINEAGIDENLRGKCTSGFYRPNLALVMLFKQVNVVCSQLLFHHMSYLRVSQHLHFLSVFPMIETYLFNIGGDKFL